MLCCTSLFRSSFLSLSTSSMVSLTSGCWWTSEHAPPRVCTHHLALRAGEPCAVVISGGTGHLRQKEGQSAKFIDLLTPLSKDLVARFLMNFPVRSMESFSQVMRCSWFQQAGGGMRQIGFFLWWHHALAGGACICHAISKFPLPNL